MYTAVSNEPLVVETEISLGPHRIVREPSFTPINGLKLHRDRESVQWATPFSCFPWFMASLFYWSFEVEWTIPSPNVVLHSDGKVEFKLSLRIDSNCNFDLFYYPRDNTRCTLSFFFMDNTGVWDILIPWVKYGCAANNWNPFKATNHDWHHRIYWGGHQCVSTISEVIGINPVAIGSWAFIDYCVPQ